MKTPSLAADNEWLAAEGFDKQSAVFDALYASDKMIAYKRRRVRSHIAQYLAAGSHILELNAGTGEDAVYFAGAGHRVHATDISTGMLQQLLQKVEDDHLQEQISTELCSFTHLDNLQQKGPYDMVFSNFAGLNCTGELDKVLIAFPELAKPGGLVTLVVLSPFCLWEFLLLFRGKIKTALRRLAGKRGASAHVEGNYFTCYYYPSSYIVQKMKQDFELLCIEGLCTISPPSYIQGFADTWPRLYRTLCRWEEKTKCSRPWKYIGDYYMISFRRK